MGTAANRCRAAMMITAAATARTDIIATAPPAIIAAIGLVIIDTDAAVIGVAATAIDTAG
jgi:hypothetical protein